MKSKFSLQTAISRTFALISDMFLDKAEKFVEYFSVVDAASEAG